MKQKGVPLKLLLRRRDFPEDGLTPRARGCESYFLGAANENVNSLVDLYHLSRALIRRDTAAQMMQCGEKRGRPGSATDRRQNCFKRKWHPRLRYQFHQAYGLEGV